MTRPDPKKGEQLVLFTTAAVAEHKALQAWAKTNGVTELMVPRDIRVIEALPVLGTGKLDYVTMSEMAVLSPMKASGEQESDLEVAEEVADEG